MIIMSKSRWLGVGITAVIFTLFIFLTLPLLIFAQESTPVAISPTPTVDRLAAPPTVPAPTQADEGAQLYWLYCQPCHGDQGQGLTDEWRAQFPEEEQNCWQSGCHSQHGKDLPEFGFILPTAVPPITGDDSLPGFATMGQLYAYISSEMPLELPGKLTESEYLAIVAHLARKHGIWDGTELDKENIAQMRLQPLAVEPTTSPVAENEENSASELSPVTTPQPNKQDGLSFDWRIGGSGVAMVAIVILGSIRIWRRRN